MNNPKLFLFFYFFNWNQWKIQWARNCLQYYYQYVRAWVCVWACERPNEWESQALLGLTAASWCCSRKSCWTCSCLLATSLCVSVCVCHCLNCTRLGVGPVLFGHSWPPKLLSHSSALCWKSARKCTCNTQGRCVTLPNNRNWWSMRWVNEVNCIHTIHNSKVLATEQHVAWTRQSSKHLLA